MFLDDLHLIAYHCNVVFNHLIFIFELQLQISFLIPQLINVFLAVRMKDTNNFDNVESNLHADYVCSICYFYPTEPIVTPCGHLFCWPCYFYASKSNEYLQCYMCKTKIRLVEVCPIQTPKYMERVTHTMVNNINIPPRPKTLCRKIKKRMKINWRMRKIEVRITRKDQSYIAFVFFMFMMYIYYLKNKFLG